jgi:uncharacterized protein YbbC (DUF1343 family)
MYLSSRRIPGVSFVPRRFTPNAGKYKDQELEAVEVILNDRHSLNAVELGVEMVCALNKIHPGLFDIHKQIRLVGNEDTAKRIAAGEDPRAIAATWKVGEQRFREIRAKYLLYK